MVKGNSLMLKILVLSAGNKTLGLNYKKILMQLKIKADQ